VTVSEPKLIGRPRTLDDDFIRRLRTLEAAGLSANRVAKDLNAAGVPGAHGGRWYPATIRRLRRTRLPEDERDDQLEA
jgi:hypothetical protein